MAPVDIEEFYDADPRRRSGEDRQFGLGWRDAADDHSLYDLYWNSGTGELYLMRKPVVDPLIGWTGYALEDDARALSSIEHRIVGAAEHLIHPRQVRAKTGVSPGSDAYKEALTEDLTVEVLGVIPDAATVDKVLAGWEEAMDRPDSLAWLRERLKAEGVTAGS
jgi:hypothetical protein